MADAFKSIVPKDFMCDEITTDGHGMRVFELMSLHVIVIKMAIGNSRFKWTLADEWDEKSMIVCLDGISLDRHQ